MSTEPNPKPVRVWRRAFRLRTLIVLIAILALPMALLVNRSKTQRQAVETIERANGRVRYDHDFKNADLISDFERNLNGTPWGPGWLRRAIGDEPFQEVVMVMIWPGLEEGDGVVEALSRLRGLQILQVSLDEEDHLARLRPLRNLPGLMIDRCEVSEAGLAILADFDHLRYLSINRTNFDGAGLGRIKGLKDLESFHVYNPSRIGDDGMAVLGGFNRLRSLILSQSQVNDAGLAELGGLLELRTLMIARTKVGDAGMETLARLKKLEYLDLEGTEITDAGLAKLEALPNLKDLVVGRTKVTPAGIAAIKAKIPGLSVR